MFIASFRLHKPKVTLVIYSTKLPDNMTLFFFFNKPESGQSLPIKTQNQNCRHQNILPFLQSLNQGFVNNLCWASKISNQVAGLDPQMFMGFVYFNIIFEEMFKSEMMWINEVLATLHKVSQTKNWFKHDTNIVKKKNFLTFFINIFIVLLFFPSFFSVCFSS